MRYYEQGHDGGLLRTDIRPLSALEWGTCLGGPTLALMLLSGDAGYSRIRPAGFVTGVGLGLCMVALATDAAQR